MKSTTSLAQGKEIKRVEDLIESRQLMRALKMIDMLMLQSKYSSSAAYLLALKALVHAMTGAHPEARRLCEHSRKFFSNDTSALPKVLNTLQTVCHLLGEQNSAISYYEYAVVEVPNNLDLMKGLFYCYHRESLFVEQLHISLKLYDLNKKPKFLLWSVFCLQLEVCCQLLGKHMADHNINNEPQKFLVYISVMEEQKEDVNNNVACEILSKLGPTLLVAQVGRRRRIEGLRLLARVSDYIASVCFLGQFLESRPAADRGQITQDLSGPHAFLLACISSLCKDECGSEMSRVLKCAALLSGRERCLTDSPRLDKAVNNYFNKHGSNAKVCLQVFTKAEELLLFDNLLNENDQLTDPNALQKEFSSLVNISSERRIGPIRSGLKSPRHGTSIALKTKEFIIIAADGMLTSSNSYDALALKADKLKDFDGMCVALTGDWKTSSRMLSALNTCINFLEDKGKGRPTVKNFAAFARGKLSARVSGGIGFLFGAFDESKDGEVFPCVAYANEHTSYEIKEPFFCGGTGSMFANNILRQGEVHEGMELGEAIRLVERALASANEYDGGCTGGWANIHVIMKNGTITRMPREHISSTLRMRHFSSSVFEDVPRC